MSFGLSSNGFDPKRLTDIRTELENELKARFGNIDVSADSVFGQIIGVFSKILTDLWEQMEVVYFSQYPDSAEGVALDNAVALTGITRRPATHSSVLLAVRGVAGSVIPSGTQARVIVEGDLFRTLEHVTIDQTAVLRGIVGIDDVEDSTVYTVTVNAINYTANSGIGATADSISADIAAAMVAISGIVVTDLGGALLIEGASFDFDVDSNMSWWTPIEAEAIETGRVVAPKGTLNVIETPVSGLDAVNNFEDTSLGRDVETDAEIRIRRAQSLNRGGAATLEAIRSRMLEEVADVLDCYVFENATDVTDIEGRPPHSIEVVVSGGSDADVAAQIWNTKPAGIATYGSLSELVEDSQGSDHNIQFSRPFERAVWVRVLLDSFDEEEFPDDGTAQVAANIKQYGDDYLTIGKDLIIQRLFKPIYEVVGIEEASLYAVLIDLDVTINDSEDANLAALFTNTLTPAKGLALRVGDKFQVHGTGDTTNNALQSAKGGGVVADDVFRITGIGPATAVAYSGNLTNAPYGAFAQTNVEVNSTEIAVFDLVRIHVEVVP